MITTFSASQRAVAALGAAALALLAFLTSSGDLSGGTSQSANTWVEILVVLAGAAALSALVIQSRSAATSPGPRSLRTLLRPAASPLLFAVLALLSALSIGWSIVPDVSWAEAGRTLAYVAAFTVAFSLARLAPQRTVAAVAAVGLSALAIATWALVVKIFNLNLYSQPSYGRLLAPFGYWNATGLSGALALGPLVHLAAGRPRSRPPAALPGAMTIGAPMQSALATAGISIATSVVILSYSRSALAGAIVAVALPLFFIAARRRAVLVLVIGLLGAVPACVFASTDYTLYKDHDSLLGFGGPALHRTDAALLLGLITLISLGLVVGATRVLIGRLDGAPPGAAALRRCDLALRSGVAAVPGLIIIFLLVNARGPFGEISHLWSTLTGTNAATGDGAGRLTSLNNSRSAYWHQAWAVATHHLLAGTGAGSFDPAYLRYPAALLTLGDTGAGHAHSYLLETFAALGLLGLLLTIVQLAVWVSDARRAVGHSSGVSTVERDARWALIAAVIAYGVNSSVDWTWYFPGVVVPALVGAGWISGVAGLPTPAAQRGAGARLPLSRRPGAILALTALTAVALALCWGVWQPLRSTQSDNAALTAVTAGNAGQAITDADRAGSEDPESLAPAQTLAAIYVALKEPTRAQSELVRETQLQSANPQPFAQLGGYLVCNGHYGAALSPLREWARLDLTNSQTQETMIHAAETHQRPASTICKDYL